MKARVRVGHTKQGLTSYRNTDFNNLEGADIVAEDGLGNIIEVIVREGDFGYRVSLNHKELVRGDTKP